jgi:hypothetical protein
MESKRLKIHRKNAKLEAILKEVNNLLGPVESEVITSFKKNKYPVILIVGCARSGTTLLLQWLAGSGAFCYPTNMLSRFYEAPHIGAKIQLMLTKYDFNKEIFDFQEEVPFSSSLGKTRGALAPNEFWYFWRRFFHYRDIQYLKDEDLRLVDSQRFLSELAAIEAVFDKPLAMKAMIVNWNIPFVSKILDKALFIFMKRLPFYNIQSLLESRRKFYGSLNTWYSFKPPEYADLKDHDPFEQVAGQVYHTNCAVEEAMKGVEPSRRLVVSYEDFCMGPEQVYSQIAEKLSLQGCTMDMSCRGPDHFENTNKVRMSDEDCEKIKAAYKNLSGVEIST